MVDRVLSFLAPHECVGCGYVGSLLCADCAAALPKVAERCYRCHRYSANFLTCKPCRSATRLNSVKPVTYHADAARQLVWKLKFYNAKAAANEAAKYMTPLVGKAETGILVTHAPTATSRVRRRGYDQAELMAKSLARQSGLSHVSALRRLGQHQQVGAPRRERTTQLKQAFQVSRPAAVCGRRVILVDDVLTTGATLEAAAAALKKAGAKKVDGLVFAQA